MGKVFLISWLPLFVKCEMMFRHYVSVVSVRVIGESDFMDEFLKSSDNHITVSAYVVAQEQE